jgi:hypothetical protein
MHLKSTGLSRSVAATKQPKKTRFFFSMSISKWETKVGESQPFRKKELKKIYKKIESHLHDLE